MTYYQCQTINNNSCQNFQHLYSCFDPNDDGKYDFSDYRINEDKIDFSHDQKAPTYPPGLTFYIKNDDENRSSTPTASMLDSNMFRKKFSNISPPRNIRNIGCSNNYRETNEARKQESLSQHHNICKALSEYSDGNLISLDFLKKLLDSTDSDIDSLINSANQKLNLCYEDGFDKNSIKDDISDFIIKYQKNLDTKFIIDPNRYDYIDPNVILIQIFRRNQCKDCSCRFCTQFMGNKDQMIIEKCKKFLGNARTQGNHSIELKEKLNEICETVYYCENYVSYNRIKINSNITLRELTEIIKSNNFVKKITSEQTAVSRVKASSALSYMLYGNEFISTLSKQGLIFSGITKIKINFT